MPISVLQAIWWSARSTTATTLQFAMARKVGIVFPEIKQGDEASIDGELVPLEAETEIVIHPGGLKVLAPTGEQGD